MPKNLEKSDTMRITPALFEASARLARATMEPDPEIPQLHESKLKRQQKKDTETAEKDTRFKGPFLKPFDEDVIKPHANTQNIAPDDHGRLEQVFWGEAIALRLLGRVDADGNEDNQRISKHLMIPRETTGDPESSTSSTLLMGSAASTGLKPYLQEVETLMTFPPPAHVKSVSSPITGHVQTMHLPLSPHKAMPPPPVPYKGSIGRTQRRLLTSLSYRPNPKHITYTHGSQPLFLPPELVAAATTTIQPTKKRRSHPTEDEAHLIMGEDDGKLQRLRRRGGVRLVTDSTGVSQGIKSTTARKIKLSPLVPTCDQYPRPSIENKTSHGPLLGQLPLPKFSSYVPAWDQVPKSSSGKVFSRLSPYVSTWDQEPKSVSEKEISQEIFPGQITLPVESKPHDFYEQDADADTAAAARGSGSQVLPRENVLTTAESVSSSTKKESDPSESELKMADSYAERTRLAGLQIKNRIGESKPRLRDTCRW